MKMLKERQEIVEYGKKLITSGLTKGTGGNISVFNRELGIMAISPSGLDYFTLKPEDIVLMDLEGHVLEGKYKPSSEFQMHSYFYKRRKDVNAVLHAHCVYIGVLGTLRIDLPASHYLVAFGGSNKVKCADYASFGSLELAKNAYFAMGDSNAVILANHGVLTVGSSMNDAFTAGEILEHCAKIYVKALSVGKAQLLSDPEMNKILELFKTYGQK